MLTRPVGIALLPALAWRMWDDNGRRFDRTLAFRAVPLLLPPRTRASRPTWWRTGLPGATELAQERGWGREAEPLLVLALRSRSCTGCGSPAPGRATCRS